MVTKEIFKGQTTDSHGLRILNLDGLQAQYQRNLSYELKVNDAVKNVTAYLHSERPEVQQLRTEIMNIEEDDNVALTEESREILQRLEIGPEDMKHVFEIEDELESIQAQADIPFAQLSQPGLLERYVQAQMNVGNNDKAEDIEATYKRVQSLISKRAAIIGGAKTKIWKRDLNLIQLARLRRPQE
jgi:hypothetical protein